MSARQILATLFVAVIAALLVSVVAEGKWPLIAFLLVCFLGLVGRLRI